jgi:hypothetical protein
MAMTSMKMSAEEAKEEMTCDSTPREYPYGLEIRLDDEGLAKLGMSTPPAVGAEMVITAKVIVTSASQYQNQGSDPEMSSCWQITDMEVAASSSTNAAKSLYGGSND